MKKGNDRAPRYIAWLIAIQSLSIVGILSLHRFPRLVRSVGNELHAPVLRSTEIASILIATVLLLCARGINLRRRRAWILATALQVILILVTTISTIFLIVVRKREEVLAFRELGISHFIIEVVILLILVRFRKSFRTISDAHTRRRAFSIFLKVTSVSFMISLLFVMLDRKAFMSAPDLLQAIQVVAKGLCGISAPFAFVSTHAQDRIEFPIGALGLLIAMTTTIEFLRPIKNTFDLKIQDKDNLKALLSKYRDHDSLAYFSLRDNKNVLWSTNGKAAIPYSVTNGVMLTTGDPIGDRESWPDAMAQYLEVAELHAWVPAIYGCTEEAGSIWVRETKFESLEIGDEAIVDVESFTLEGPAMKNVRHMVGRISRKGYTTSIRTIKDIDAAELLELRKLADHWRRGESERGFSMALGRLCDPQDSEAVLVVAEFENRPMGILQFVPWGDDGLSLDLMRRSHEAEAGLNELLITSTIEYCRSSAINKISLNFATFRSIFERGEKLGAGPITRVTHKLLVFLSRFVQMESLYRFNGKFRPVWEPRYVLFPKIGNLVRVAVAILMIESFIKIPGKTAKLISQ